MAQQDATVILVGHSYYDLEAITLYSRLVIDTTDVTRPLDPKPTVVKL